jgi:hypothetical protein
MEEIKHAKTTPQGGITRPIVERQHTPVPMLLIVLEICVSCVYLLFFVCQSPNPTNQPSATQHEGGTRRPRLFAGFNST